MMNLLECPSNPKLYIFHMYMDGCNRLIINCGICFQATYLYAIDWKIRIVPLGDIFTASQCVYSRWGH